MSQSDDMDDEISELREQVEELESRLETDQEDEVTDLDFLCPKCGLTAFGFASPEAASTALRTHVADKHGVLD